MVQPEHPEIPVRTYEIDLNSPVRFAIWKRLRIAATPTVILYKDGAAVLRIAGHRPLEQLRAEIAVAVAGGGMERDIA